STTPSGGTGSSPSLLCPSATSTSWAVYTGGSPAQSSKNIRASGVIATLFTLLLAGCQALLARWTGREDLAVGTVVSGRIHPDLEGIAGVFLNPLPLRADLSGDPQFGELVDRARASLLQALENQGVPFHAWLGVLRRRSGRSDLMPCSVWVTLVGSPLPLPFEGLTAIARSYASAPGVGPAAGGGLLLHALESA